MSNAAHVAKGLLYNAVTMSTHTVRAHIQWMRLRNLASSTITTRRGILELLERTVGDALTATHQDIETMIGNRRFKPTTRNLWIAHLGAFYRWAIDEQLLVVNPIRRVPRAIAPVALPRPIPEPVLAAALAAANPRMRAWLTLGAYGGLRCIEMSHLVGENVSLELATMRIDFSKRGRTRVIPLHPKVAEALAPAMKPGRLWAHNPKVVSILINRHLQQLGPYTAHMLRHRFACQVYEGCGDLNIVRELLGHATTATTQVYAAISARRTSAAVALIA